MTTVDSCETEIVFILLLCFPSLRQWCYHLIQFELEFIGCNPFAEIFFYLNHQEPAVAFAEKGYHILLEKPMAVGLHYFITTG